MKLKHRFVDFIPDKIEDNILYISLDHGTVIHKCPCGCGMEVNTVLHPTGWSISYDGESISIKPSIGNWGFKCKSHYWITDNVVKWSYMFSDKEIDETIVMEGLETKKYFKEKFKKDNEERTSSLEEDKKWYSFLFSWVKYFYPPN